MNIFDLNNIKYFKVAYDIMIFNLIIILFIFSFYSSAAGK